MKNKNIMVFFFTAILSALLMVLDRKSNDLRDAAQKCYQKAHQHFRIRKSVLQRPWETIPHAEIGHEGIWLYTLEFQKRHPCPEVVRFFFITLILIFLKQLRLVFYTEN